MLSWDKISSIVLAFTAQRNSSSMHTWKLDFCLPHSLKMLMDIGQHYTVITQAIFKFRFIVYFNGSEIIISTQKLATLGFLYLNQCLAAG